MDNYTHPSLQEVEIAIAKRSYIEWMKYNWMNPRKPLVVGRPTIEISNTIDWCLERYRKGTSSTVIINVPPRNGKSDQVSRFLAPRFLGEFPDEEVLIVSYNQEKTKEFNRFSRSLIESAPYKNAYPEITLDQRNRSVKEFGVQLQGKTVVGKSQYAGFQGGVAGKGSALLIIDDYLRNRKDAESQIVRNGIFEEFESGMLTRLEEVYIFIILATRWHPDDLTGRIIEEDSIKIDRHIILPALSEEYESGTLFPERFPLEKVLLKKKQISSYAFNSLYQQEPTLRGGNIFKYENIIEVDKEPDIFKNANLVRCWDIASSDPSKNDWTVGIKGKYIVVNKLEYIYIDSIDRFQKTSVYRDRIIKDRAESEKIRVGIECYGPYKDTFNNIKHVIKGVCTLKPLTPPGSKEVKAEPLEPIIEFNRFYINAKNCKRHLDELKKEIKEFPSSKHDDIVDAIALIWWLHKQTSSNQYLKIAF